MEAPMTGGVELGGVRRLQGPEKEREARGPQRYDAILIKRSIDDNLHFVTSREHSGGWSKRLGNRQLANQLDFLRNSLEEREILKAMNGGEKKSGKQEKKQGGAKETVLHP